MTDFQVGDRVSVEGVVRAVDACDGWFCVDPTGDDVRTYEIWHGDLTLIERPRRKLRVGSVWQVGELLRGDADGGLQGFDGYIGADEITADSELVRVRVVEA